MDSQQPNEQNQQSPSEPTSDIQATTMADLSLDSNEVTSETQTDDQATENGPVVVAEESGTIAESPEADTNIERQSDAEPTSDIQAVDVADVSLESNDLISETLSEDPAIDNGSEIADSEQEITAESPEEDANPESLEQESAEASDEKAVDESGAKPSTEVAADESPATLNGFQVLGLTKKVLQAVEETGYTQPTEIQSQIIPEMLNGRDVLAQSQTGSGKTAAFALPILSTIDAKANRPRVLVLAPTRELANQVARSFEVYASQMPGIKVLAIYGGADYDTQFRKLKKGVQIVVGTPGRVIDHINRGTLNLSEIDTLVLDEADEMLNMGFLEDVEFVLDKTPKGRRVALFSATLPTPIRKIAKRYLNDPARITVKRKTVTAESIRQRAVFVSPRDKTDALIRFLEAEDTDGVIIFTRTKDATVSLAETLSRVGYQAVALNGDLPQKNRERAIENLKQGRLDILVATDVAARGLDVQRISHVFNYDLPEGTESYIHRVGRTGRAGRKGEAIIFLSRSQRRKLSLIEKVTKQTIEVISVPETKDINQMRIQKFKQKIDKAISEDDLSFFKNLLNEYVEESGQPLDAIAAALAHIGQRGQPFLMKDAPKRKERNREDRDGKRGRNNRGFRPVEDGMSRYRIAVGRRDGVRPGNIVGAVANEAGINGDYIGPIRIFDSYSTIDLPEGLPEDVHETLRNAWVAGRQLRIRLYDDEGPRRSRPGFGKPRGGGKRRKPSHHGRGDSKRGSFQAKRKKSRSK